MPSIPTPAVCRRRLLQIGAACAFVTVVRPALAVTRADGRHGLATALRAGPARVRMVGDEFPETEVWTYNGGEPGPVLRRVSLIWRGSKRTRPDGCWWTAAAVY